MSIARSMLTIQCGDCRHQWVRFCVSGRDWTSVLVEGDCPGCGQIGSARSATSEPVPDIKDILASMASCNVRPPKPLKWHVLRDNAGYPLVALNVEYEAREYRFMALVDQSSRCVVKAWVQEVAPKVMPTLRMPDGPGGLRGSVADMILTLALDTRPVCNWQLWTAAMVRMPLIGGGAC